MNLTEVNHWIAPACEHLIGLRSSRVGWGYRPQSSSFVEPTVLACLGLLAHDNETQFQAVVSACADWLAELQQPHGAIGLSAELSEPHWPTAYALLLWSATNTHKKACDRAVDFLLRREGVAFKKEKNAVIGHDTTIVAWPWIDDTHSWVEPTALTITALTKSKVAVETGRVQDGLRMLVDRAIPTGGWNYGNNKVFGTALRPRPAPTGLALLALTKGDPQLSVVRAAVDYLQDVLPTTRSAQSLCWGTLGLLAWNQELPQASKVFAEAAPMAKKRSDAPLQLAYLLLAAGGKRSLELLGIVPRSLSPHET